MTLLNGNKNKTPTKVNFIGVAYEDTPKLNGSTDSIKHGELKLRYTLFSLYTYPGTWQTV